MWKLAVPESATNLICWLWTGAAAGGHTAMVRAILMTDRAGRATLTGERRSFYGLVILPTESAFR